MVEDKVVHKEDRSIKCTRFDFEAMFGLPAHRL